MGSRREEERNEKIIRGLMKLPPNRRCINCNSLGPQYVCTNFWTFVCMTCGGIHREFTHRVKSVSMSKFTSQEVDALQNGGNQRAREIYLKDWDMQTQRLFSSSNADKVREFIKNVYVDRNYAGGKSSNKPPRDMQGLKNHEDDTRRASSYHSYSQSPPYDYQYEDRHCRRQVGSFSRKPGSDRGYYIGKISSLIGSPGSLSDQTFEESFANEGSAPRASDYSLFSGGDPFRHGTDSPSFQDSGFSSPTSQPSREVLSEDTRHQTINLFAEPNPPIAAQGNPHMQRTTSSASTGSFDSNFTSFKSYNTSSMVDVVTESHQTVGSYQDNASTFPRSSAPVNYGGLDLFNAPESSAPPPADFFLPAASSVPSTEMFQPATVPATSLHQLPQITPSIDLFAQIAEHSSAVKLDVKSPELSIPKNEGWATFDTQPAASNPGIENHSAEMLCNGDFSLNFDNFSSLNASTPWPLFEGPGAAGAGAASSVSSPWQEGLHNVQAPTVAASTQSWNSFEDFVGQNSLEGVKQKQSNERDVLAYRSSVIADHNPGLGVSEDSNNHGIQRAAYHPGTFVSTVSSDFGMTPFSSPSMFHLVGEKQSHAADQKSNNPFDLPYDSDMEHSNMFFDMSSLQAALPNFEMSSTLVTGVSEQWFPHNPVTPFIPAVPQGGLAYVPGQPQSSQLLNVQAQGPVASVGGNPFA
ncbi:hypothetical protein SLEP1_g39381 [Rubroshorea leprosula]|uniref:Arf-GAP domain-containing protein n=1 Tax=Rubroshorea leprosula TaxID=152421 RepID=A0AAV5L0U0_9ROSI|nr:hypothetical protein SLEP1_g39381 [Rubroshorea leprosula]